MGEKILKTPEEHVAKWLGRSKKIQNKHYDAAATLMRWHRWTGGTLVVLSVIEGSTLLQALTSNTKFSAYEAIVVGAIGLAVAVLAALQAFMSFETRSRLHYIGGVKYGAIKRRLEAKIAADSDMSRVAAYLEELGPEWDALTEESEPIPLRIWESEGKGDGKGKGKGKGKGESDGRLRA